MLKHILLGLYPKISAFQVAYLLHSCDPIFDTNLWHNNTVLMEVQRLNKTIRI